MKTNSQAVAISLLSALIVLLYSLATGTPETSHAIPSGYLTGSDFRKMSTAEKFAYATGLTDGYFAAPHFSGASPGWKKLYSCLTQRDYDRLGADAEPSRGMSNEQITAIFDKYLTEHPEEWHMPMNALGISALYKSCDMK